MCTQQYLKFWGKLLWSLLYPSNVMCYMHCMIVMAILSTNMKLKSAHCAVSGNVLYVHSPILRILWQALVRLTIPINVMCYIHCVMVLVMVSPQNRWYIVKISMCHWWVSITGNTWWFDTSSFDPCSVHIGLPPDRRGNNYNYWNICCGWINHLQCRFTQCGLYQMPQTQY